jgi:hypothetical protein
MAERRKSTAGHRKHPQSLRLRRKPYSRLCGYASIWHIHRLSPPDRSRPPSPTYVHGEKAEQTYGRANNNIDFELAKSSEKKPRCSWYINEVPGTWDDNEPKRPTQPINSQMRRTACLRVLLVSDAVGQDHFGCFHLSRPAKSGLNIWTFPQLSHTRIIHDFSPM